MMPCRSLPRALDPTDGKKVTRSLMNLSRGGSDAVHVKEFDFVKGDFVRLPSKFQFCMDFR